MELLKIDFDEQTVSARELHEQLKIGTPYHKWFPRMCEYGFVENDDYSVTDKKVHNSNGGKQNIVDADISMDMAKQICMLQRTEEGKKIRQYLIDLEMAWNTPEQVMARALKIADKEIERLAVINTQQQVKLEEQKPKVLFAEAVSASEGSILVGDLAKLIAQNGYEIGQKRLFNWLRDNGYLIKSGSSKNMPTQRFVEQGLFEIKESVVNNPDDSIRIIRTTKVTGKGQVYFIQKFLKMKEKEDYEE